MEISRKEVEKIAHMARLKLDEQELDGYMADMKNIMNLAAQLNEVDTSSILPMAHPLEQAQVLRADLVDFVADKVERDYFQKIAPQVKDGYYLVPQVIEGRDSPEDEL